MSTSDPCTDFPGLPDELLELIITARLGNVDYDTFSDHSPAELIQRRLDAYHLCLVNRQFYRNVRAALYETVILTSRQGANALASLFRSDSTLGSQVRKLRLEGGYGEPVGDILTACRGIEWISISLDIHNAEEGEGLCKGLALINPSRVVVRDSEILQGNEGSWKTLSNLFQCMGSTDRPQVWTNMVSSNLSLFFGLLSHTLLVQISYDHPYDENLWRAVKSQDIRYRDRKKRAHRLSDATQRIPTLKQVYVPQGHYVRPGDVVWEINGNPSVEKIYARKPYIPGLTLWWEDEFTRWPQLRNILHLPLPGPWATPNYAPVGDRSR